MPIKALKRPRGHYLEASGEEVPRLHKLGLGRFYGLEYDSLTAFAIKRVLDHQLGITEKPPSTDDIVRMATSKVVVANSQFSLLCRGIDINAVHMGLVAAPGDRAFDVRPGEERFSIQCYWK